MLATARGRNFGHNNRVHGLGGKVYGTRLSGRAAVRPEQPSSRMRAISCCFCALGYIYIFHDLEKVADYAEWREQRIWTRRGQGRDANGVNIAQCQRTGGLGVPKVE